MHQAIVVFDIDGVVRDVSNSYRRAIADTVEHFTQGAYRPSPTDIDALKSEGIWNNDWEASQELIYRHFERQNLLRSEQPLDYQDIVAFFQARYRGSDPVNWDGYITQEPLLMQASYLASLTAANIAWGFFSGATRGSAHYILQRRLGLDNPILIAMEDAPGKPDPTGLFATIRQVEQRDFSDTPVVYVGDTVADMYTIAKARQQQPDRLWYAVGTLPPHIQTTAERQASYRETLQGAGAQLVLDNVQELTPDRIQILLQG